MSHKLMMAFFMGLNPSVLAALVSRSIQPVMKTQLRQVLHKDLAQSSS
jgi:hypothetical protein